MNRYPRAPAALASLILLLCLLLAVSVNASHYRLAAGFELVTDAERTAFKRAHILTTAQLLGATAKRRSRRALAKKTRLTFTRLTALAEQCDLLRIKGLGPSGVRLIQAARIGHVASLKLASASTLHAKLETLKSTLALPQVVPTVAELSGWIAQAKRLPRVLEGPR